MVINMWKTTFILCLIVLTVHGKANRPKKRVCMIGSGASGLITAKYLSAYPDEFEPIVFEKQSDVGGLWIYTDSTTVDEHGLPVHSSLYKYLRTNFPAENTFFPDYPEFYVEEGKSTFVRHEILLQYLRNYTDHFNLRQYVQLNTNVEKVSPLSRNRWLVAARDLNTKKRKEVICDAVVVANGHNVKGNIPEIPGIESFPGRVIHSHLYRKPEIFANQTVVVLGASFSGVDIGIEITWFAKTVYLSSRHDKLPAELPTNMVQVAGVVSADGSDLILSDGTRIKADALVLCTGYVYDFPFLDASSGIVVEEGKYIRSVYKHLINIARPTMAIMNILNPGFPLRVPHAQANYFISVLRGKLKLPSRRKMLQDAALPPGVPKSKAHYMAAETVGYYNELATAGGIDPLPDWYVAAGLLVLPELLGDPLHFREKRLYFNDDGTVEFR